MYKAPTSTGLFLLIVLLIIVFIIAFQLFYRKRVDSFFVNRWKSDFERTIAEHDEESRKRILSAWGNRRPVLTIRKNGDVYYELDGEGNWTHYKIAVSNKNFLVLYGYNEDGIPCTLCFKKLDESNLRYKVIIGEHIVPDENTLNGAYYKLAHLENKQ